MRPVHFPEGFQVDEEAGIPLIIGICGNRNLCDVRKEDLVNDLNRCDQVATQM